ncbi:hypothetical protein CEXT_260141 [Caerostris extrusa]|uniref:Uncharacterized protein n=1 Tax=Caerostris extrusa TaxID=172846 RepID=A0AAV4VQ40_CAEEX|nr:hypothetical protein CEXT_260141 [Caerostris extrusa]
MQKSNWGKKPTDTDTLTILCSSWKANINFFAFLCPVEEREKKNKENCKQSTEVKVQGRGGREEKSSLPHIFLFYPSVNPAARGAQRVK